MFMIVCVLSNSMFVKMCFYALCYRWTGSNTNDRNNAGQGLAGTDRSNVVPMSDWGKNFPSNVSTANFLGFEEKDLLNLAILRPSKFFIDMLFKKLASANCLKIIKKKN